MSALHGRQNPHSSQKRARMGHPRSDISNISRAAAPAPHRRKPWSKAADRSVRATRETKSPLKPKEGLNGAPGCVNLFLPFFGTAEARAHSRPAGGGARATSAKTMVEGRGQECPRYTGDKVPTQAKRGLEWGTRVQAFRTFRGRRRPRHTGENQGQRPRTGVSAPH